MNYGDLQTRVTDILGRTDVPTASYNLVINDVNDNLQLRVMETTVTLSSPYLLPADFLSPVRVYVNTTPRLPLRPATGFGYDSNYQAGSYPAEFIVGSDNIFLNPDNATDIVLVYTASLAEFSAAGDTNDVLNRFPAMFTYGALFHFGRLVRDDALMASYSPLYQQAIASAKEADLRSRYSGGVMYPNVSAA